MQRSVFSLAGRSGTRVVTSLIGSQSVLQCDNADLTAWMSNERDTMGISKAEANRMKTQFYNAGQRRCLLCDEHIEATFTAHCGYVGHIARMGIVERAVSVLQESPPLLSSSSSFCSSSSSSSSLVARRTREIIRTWWRRLNENEADTLVDFKRIHSLSANERNRRLWRLRFLIEFLRDREVIRNSLTLTRSCPGASENSFIRTHRFERSEMIGDNIVKVVVPDRLIRVFPASEGGVTYKIACIQQLLDSNEGLLQIYDYIDLNSIIGTRLPNSKTKADVVECLFGELQTFLWASEVVDGMNSYPAIPTVEHRYVRALVDHLLNELTHAVIMWRIETTLENAKEFLEEHAQRRIPRQQTSGVIKEEELDRPRYATLPLLLSFSRSVMSPTAKRTDTRRSLLLSPPVLLERGTPLALLEKPMSVPNVMAAHYFPTLRLVHNAVSYRREVLEALQSATPKGASEEFSSSMMTTPSVVSFARGAEVATQRYASWGFSNRLAEVRQGLQKRLEQRGVLVSAGLDWGGLLNALIGHINCPKADTAISHGMTLHAIPKARKVAKQQSALPLSLQGNCIPQLTPMPPS